MADVRTRSRDGPRNAGERQPPADGDSCFPQRTLQQGASSGSGSGRLSAMDRTRNKGFLIAIRRFVRDRRGVSVLEFALILPVMLTLFLGGTEVTQGITIKRKTTIVTRSLADLVAQDFSVNDAE